MAALNATPLVSVIMPSFNAAATVRETLASVCGQSFSDQEILVVDDGSADATLDHVTAAMQADPRIRLIRRAQNGGPAAARNSGLAEARGRYTAFIDADDLWDQDKIERQVRALDANPRAVICCCNARWVRDGVPEGTVYDGCQIVQGADAWKSILADSFIGTPCAVLVTEVARRIGGFDETLRVGQDQDMWLRMALAGEVVALPEILVRYRLSPASHIARNRHLSFELWLPRLERHIAELRPRLSLSELRYARRTRYRLFARNLYLDGRIGDALRLFGYALWNGANPLRVAAFLVWAAPPMRRIKAHCKRWLGR